MIVLSIKVRRRSDLDPQTFEDRCRGEWLEAVQDALPQLGADRVVLELPVRGAWTPCARSAHGLEGPFDALLRVYWADASSYASGAGSPVGLAVTEQLASLRDRIADRAGSAVLLTETASQPA